MFLIDHIKNLIHHDFFQSKILKIVIKICFVTISNTISLDLCDYIDYALNQSQLLWYAIIWNNQLIKNSTFSLQTTVHYHPIELTYVKEA